MNNNRKILLKLCSYIIINGEINSHKKGFSSSGSLLRPVFWNAEAEAVP